LKKEPLIESSMAFVSSCSGIVIVDSRTNSGTITLPAASTLAGRSIIFKDGYNSFANNSLTLSTTGVDIFENSNNNLIVNTNNGFVQLVAGSNAWYTVGTSVAGSGDVTYLQLTSTVVGLGTLGYISTAGGGSGDVTKVQLTSTVTGLGTAGYVSSLSRLLTENTCVAGGAIIDSNAFAVTSDGYNWTSSINNTLTGTVNAIAWNGAYWLAGGNYGSNLIGLSSDGYKWTSSINNPFPNGQVRKIAWNGSYWVAAGNVENNISVSTDGYNWTSSINNPFPTNESLSGIANGIAWNGSYWVAVGAYSNNTAVSTDGYNWIRSSSSIFGINGAGNCIAWNGSYWLAGGEHGQGGMTIALSSNGYNWSYASNNPFTGGACVELGWNGSYWVTLGNGSNNIAVSTDGYNWQSSINNPFIDSEAKSISWNGSYWIAVGYSNETGIIGVSYDGYNWTSLLNNPFTQIKGMAIASRRVLPYVGLNITGGGGSGDVGNIQLTSTVAGLGTAGYISSLTSIKASTIQLTYGNTVAIGYSTSMERINGLAYANGIWVAAGSNTPTKYTLQTSSNGFDWTNQIAEAFTYPVMQTVRYLNSTFFAGAVGDSITPDNSTILTSIDGSNWIWGTTPSADINDFGYNSSFYLACGTVASTMVEAEGSAYYSLFKSYDSLNWIIQPSTNITIGRGLTYASSIWVMVGSNINNEVGSNVNNAGIETSLDGSNWSLIADSNIYIPNVSNVNNSTFTYTSYNGNKVAYNSSIWVTVGDLQLSNTADAEDNVVYSFPLLVSYNANSWFAPSSLLICENVNNCGTSVLWSGSNWIVGLSNTSNTTTLSSIITSPDGLNWTYQTTSQAGKVTSIAKSDSLYIAGKSLDFQTASLEYSLNGLDWVSNFFTSSIYSSIITSQCNALLINGNLFSYSDDSINSTIDGLGALGYVSTTYLNSVIDDLANLGYASTTMLFSTVAGLGSAGYVSSTTNFLTENFCVAGATNGYVSLSYDALNWTSTINIDGFQTVNAIAWNDFYWVAVGGSATLSTIVISSDGVDWHHTPTNVLTSQVKGVAWNGSYWVATGAGPTDSVAVSVDGYNWLAASNNLFTGNSFSGLDVAWNGKYWIAVGSGSDNNNNIILSSDGYNWLTVFESPANSFRANSVAWNGSYWLATGTDQNGIESMLRSYDSYNWNYLPSNPFGTGVNYGYDVAWNGISWLAVGIRGGNVSVVSLSSDGSNWSASLNCPILGKSVAWNGSYWVVNGNDITGNNLAISSDGSNWTSILNTFPDQIGSSVASRRVLPYTGLNITPISQFELTSTVVSLGSLGYISTMNLVSTTTGLEIYGGLNLTSTVEGLGSLGYLSSAIQISDLVSTTTGLEIYGNLNLTSTVESLGSLGYLSSAIQTNDLVSTTTGLETYIDTSISGLGTDGYLSSFNSIRSSINGSEIVYENLSIAVSKLGNSISISFDGSNWKPSSNGPFTEGQINTIAWNGSYWVIGGSGYLNSSPVIAHSSNGYDWGTSDTHPFVYGSCFGLAWNGSYWVAVGDVTGGATPNTIAVSSDANIWSRATNNPYASGSEKGARGIAWNGSYWVVVGKGNTPFDINAINVSSDGLNWTPATNNPFTNNMAQGIAWNGSYWVAVGNGTTTIAISSNGYNWTAATNNPFSGGFGTGIAWNGYYWVAVGTGTTNAIAVSSDGYNWTPSSNHPFISQTASGITWNGTYWIVTGSNIAGDVSIGVSVDGYNWTTSNPFNNYGAKAVASRNILPYVVTPITTTRYTPAHSSIWVSPPPITIYQAIDRLAHFLSTFTTSNIPLLI